MTRINIAASGGSAEFGLPPLRSASHSSPRPASTSTAQAQPAGVSGGSGPPADGISGVQSARRPVATQVGSGVEVRPGAGGTAASARSRPASRSGSPRKVGGPASTRRHARQLESPTVSVQPKSMQREPPLRRCCRGYVRRGSHRLDVADLDPDAVLVAHCEVMHAATMAPLGTLPEPPHRLLQFGPRIRAAARQDLVRTPLFGLGSRAHPL